MFNLLSFNNPSAMVIYNFGYGKIFVRVVRSQTSKSEEEKKMKR